MPAFAPAALGAAVVLSALGAVVLCVLVVLYGFTPSDEDSPEGATRRLLLTRVGHAMAAACFAATAILICIVLVRPLAAPAPAPAALPEAVLDARVPELGEQLAGQETRLTATEARIQALEHALRQQDAERSRPAGDPPAPAPPRPRPAPAPARSGAARSTTPGTHEKAVSELPTVPPPSRRPEPARHPQSTPAVGTPPPPAPAPPPPSVAEGPPPQLAPSPPAPVPPVSRPAARRSFDLPSKLREDWRDIQRGVDSAGEDFRSAVDDLRRRLLGN